MCMPEEMQSKVVGVAQKAKPIEHTIYIDGSVPRIPFEKNKPYYLTVKYVDVPVDCFIKIE